MRKRYIDRQGTIDRVGEEPLLGPYLKYFLMDYSAFFSFLCISFSPLLFCSLVLPSLLYSSLFFSFFFFPSFSLSLYISPPSYSSSFYLFSLFSSSFSLSPTRKNCQLPAKTGEQEISEHWQTAIPECSRWASPMK